MFRSCLWVCCVAYFIVVSETEINVIILPIKRDISIDKLIDSLSNSEDAQRSKINKVKRVDLENNPLPTLEPDVDNVDYDDIHKVRNGDDTQFKIVGGSEVDIDSYPYHAAYGVNCGATIIDKKWIMTAAHCGQKTFVRVGSKYFNQGEKKTIQKHYVHPMWSNSQKRHQFDYDFQLLELKDPLVYSNSVQKIPIAESKDIIVGTYISVTGWGNTEEDGPFSTVLRAARVPIIDMDVCQRVPFAYFRGTLTPRMFCAGFKEGKIDACQGDSGGPATAHGKLYGMVSFGYGCATPNSYGVYSKVSMVRTWIEGVTGLKLD